MVHLESAWASLKSDLRIVGLMLPGLILLNKLWMGNFWGDPTRSTSRYFPLHELEPRPKDERLDHSGFADDVEEDV